MQGIDNFLTSLYTISPGSAETRLVVVAQVLACLGNPQNSIPAIHIAGTSGKGSTAYYASALLQAMGYTVGLAVSPHVNTVRERSQINGTPFDEAEYVRYFHTFKTLPEITAQPLSYIEFLVIFTYWLFAKIGVNYMVIEVGLGGRLDPTNCITRPATVRAITDIGLDHTEILGTTLPQIAREKAGIIHDGDSVAMNQQPDEIVNVVQDYATHHHAKLSIVSPKAGNHSALPVFQQRNLSLACAVVSQRLALDTKPPLTEKAIQSAATITIPGRFEKFVVNNTEIILDSAHNPQKITALVESIRTYYLSQNVVYLLAFGKNKQNSLDEMIKIIAPTARYYFTTTFVDSYRSAIGSNEIIDHIASPNAKSIADPHDAFATALHYAHSARVPLVITGSFYLIDTIRKQLIIQPG